MTIENIDDYYYRIGNETGDAVVLSIYELKDLFLNITNILFDWFVF